MHERRNGSRKDRRLSLHRKTQLLSRRKRKRSRSRNRRILRKLSPRERLIGKERVKKIRERKKRKRKRRRLLSLTSMRW